MDAQVAQDPTNLTGQVVSQALAPPAATPQKPSIQNGLNSVGAGTPTPDQLSSQLMGFQKRIQSNQSEFDKQYAAIPEPQLPESEFHPLPPKESSTLFSLMMILGALGGRTTHTPMTAAMNNMTGIMRGQKEKNDQMVAAQKEQFQMNFKNGIEKAKMMLDEKQKILEKHKYDAASMQEEYNIFKLQHGIGDSVAKADMFNTAQQYKQLETMEKLSNALMLGMMKEKASLGVPSSPESRQAVAGMVASGVPLVQAVPGWGASAVTQRKEARDDAIRQIMNETGLDATNAGVELAKREVDFVAGKSSVSQLTKMLGATRVAVSQLEKNLPNAQEAMKNMGSTDMSPFFNAIINKENQWSGDPEYASVFYFMNAIAMESARLQMGGQASIAQLHQGAADEAKQWASTSMTPQALLGLGNSIIKEGKQKIESYQDAIGEQSLKPKGATSELGGTDAEDPLGIR